MDDLEAYDFTSPCGRPLKAEMGISDEKAQPPGDGFLGWLGRQVGHVTKAVKTDVTAPSKIVYRECTIEEQTSPIDPNVKLRRTIIDEVVKEVRSDECKVQSEEKNA